MSAAALVAGWVSLIQCNNQLCQCVQLAVQSGVMSMLLCTGTYCWSSCSHRERYLEV
jgi:hypothetical protein